MHTEADVAWLAGLFEGEGFITKNKNGAPILGISMTDLDVLERCKDVFGGSVIGPYKRQNPKHKPIYRWGIYAHNKVIEIVDLIYPWLLARRRARIDELMEGYREIIPGMGPGRFIHGVNHPNAILTPAKVQEIRRRVRLGELQAAVAVEFGVSRGAVNDLIRGRTWTSVEETESASLT